MHTRRPADDKTLKIRAMFRLASRESGANRESPPKGGLSGRAKEDGRWRE